MITVAGSIHLRVIWELFTLCTKGPAGNCEDDICFDIVVLWTPYLYLVS